MNDRLPYREEGEQAELPEKTFSVCYDCKWCRYHDEDYGKHASIGHPRETFDVHPLLATCGFSEKMKPVIISPLTGKSSNPPVKRVDCHDKNKSGDCEDFERYEPTPLTPRWWAFWK